MAHSRKSIENQSDRVQLEQGEARVLYTTWVVSGKRVLTADRMEYIEKRFGKGSVERIRHYMAMMKAGELD